jgi:hypothetical protein
MPRKLAGVGNMEKFLEGGQASDIIMETPWRHG